MGIRGPLYLGLYMLKGGGGFHYLLFPFFQLRYPFIAGLTMFPQIKTLNYAAAARTKTYLVGWLFCVQRLFETVYQSIFSPLTERGRKNRNMIGERKMSEQPPSTLTESTVGPCPTIIQVSMMPQHWKLPRQKNKVFLRIMQFQATRNKGDI